MATISIWIQTYNHESFIAQALQGVLMQQTSFEFEIIIGDDCSVDGTRKILHDFKQKHPDKIKLFLPEKNMGMIPMFAALYGLCKGTYVAWLDGDDYWTDPFKLQKQVDFLEANPSFVMSCHNAQVIDQLNNKAYTSTAIQVGTQELTEANFIKGYNPVYAGSVVYRNCLGSELPDWVYALPYTDFGFYFLLLQKGRISYSDETMSVYRIHKKGSYSGNTLYHNYSQLKLFFEMLRTYLPYQHGKSFNYIIGEYRYKMGKIDLENREIKKALSKFKVTLLRNTTLFWHKKREWPHLVILLAEALVFDRSSNSPK